MFLFVIAVLWWFETGMPSERSPTLVMYYVIASQMYSEGAQGCIEAAGGRGAEASAAARGTRPTPRAGEACSCRPTDSDAGEDGVCRQEHAKHTEMRARRRRRRYSQLADDTEGAGVRHS